MKNFTIFKLKHSFVLFFTIISLLGYAETKEKYTENSRDILLVQKKVTLKFENKSIADVLESIQQQSGIDFIINEGLKKAISSVTIDIKNLTVEEALYTILKGSDYTFKITNNIVTFIKALQKEDDNLSQATRQINGNVIDKEKKKPIIGATIIILGTSSGDISDEKGAFSIRAKKGDIVEVSFTGMISQAIEINDNTKELIFQMVSDMISIDDVFITGYQSLSKKKSTGSITQLKMEEINAAGLNSVDKMLEGRIPGMQFMQNSGQVGAAPKIRIRGTSTILGNQEPLWVVDGIVQNDPVKVDPASLNDLDFVNLLGNAISGLNPEDIEQIDVLKDASATAIYGVRAANGVIVITTKKGKVGKPSISYSGTGTFSLRPNYNHKDIYLMNSKERVDVSRETFERQLSNTMTSQWIGYEGAALDYKAGRISYEEFQNKVNYFESINTDWFDIVCRNSFSNKHTLSVSGGTESIRYYASIGVNDEKGVIKGESNQSYTTSIKLNANYNKFKLQFGLQGNTGDRKYTPNSTVIDGGSSVMDYAYGMSRAIPAYNEDGSRYSYPKPSGPVGAYPFNIENEMDNTKDRIKNNAMTMNANVKYEILRGLTADATLSYSVGNHNQETVFNENSYYIQTLRAGGPGDPYSTCPWGGELNSTVTTSNSYTGRLQLDFNRNLDDAEKHNLGISLGGELFSTEYSSTKTVTRGYYEGRGKTFATSNAIMENPNYVEYRKWLGANRPVITDNLTNLSSAYFIATYTYENNYIVSFNSRLDASNQFGSRSNEKLLPIWAISGRWNVSQALFPESRIVNDLSLKLSYGKQGNMLDNQTTRMIIKKGELDSWFDEFTSSIKYYPNPFLKWESTNSYNTEMTFSLFNGKVGGTVGYFYKKTNDAFLEKTISDVNGVPNYVVNKGSLSNQGVELTLNFVPINQRVGANGKKGLVWRIDPQISQVVNRLVGESFGSKSKEFRNTVTFDDYLNGTVELAGRPLNTFYSYRFAGLSPVDGRPIFHGTEEERKDELMEKYRLMTNEEVFNCVMEESGTRVPVIQGGISNYFGYRQFGLSFNFTYSFGNKIRLIKLGGTTNINPIPEKNLRREFTERWRKPGDEKYTNIPGFADKISAPWWVSEAPSYAFSNSNEYDMYDKSNIRVVSGNYLKLQSLSFRYVVEEAFCKKIGIKSAYISFSGTNLFTIAHKSLKGQDVTSQSGSATTLNLSIRPNYSFTLNFTL